jgi:hypothetical protein
VALAFPLKQHRLDSLGLAEAVCEPKPSAWLDVDRASEGHFPQQSLTKHTLPVPGRLNVLVHGILHLADSDVELTHLLSGGGPTR